MNLPNRLSGSYEQVCDSTRTDCTWKRVPIDDDEADDELGDEVELGLEALELLLSAALPVIWTRCPTYLLRSTSLPLATSEYFLPSSLPDMPLLDEVEGVVVEGVCVDGVEVDDVDEPVLELEPLSVSV